MSKQSWTGEAAYWKILQVLQDCLFLFVVWLLFLALPLVQLLQHCSRTLIRLFVSKPATPVQR